MFLHSVLYDFESVDMHAQAATFCVVPALVQMALSFLIGKFESTQTRVSACNNSAAFFVLLLTNIGSKVRMQTSERTAHAREPT